MSSNKRRAKRKRRSADNHNVVAFLHGAGDVGEILAAFRDWLATNRITDDEMLPGALVGCAELAITLATRLRPEFAPTAWTVDDVDGVIDLVEYMEDAGEDAPPTALVVGAMRMLLGFLEDTNRWTGTVRDRDAVVESLDEWIADELPEEQLQVEDVDPVRAEAALSELRLVRRLDAFLDWIGGERPTTSARWLKPALLADLGAAVGIEVPPGLKKMTDHDELADLWMFAQELQLITVNTSRAEPTPVAQLWRARPRFELVRAAANLELDVYLSAENPLNPLPMMTALALRQGMTETPMSLDIFEPDDDTEPDDDDWSSTILDEMMRDRLSGLVEAGWLSVDDAGDHVVPRDLRPTVEFALASHMGPEVGPAAVMAGGPTTRPTVVPELPDDIAQSQLTLRLDMPYIEPPVTRRIALPASMSLPALHSVIQTIMRWDDSHLHRFFTPHGRAEFGPTYDDGPSGEVAVGALINKPGDELYYNYDFGDGWEVRIVVESLADPSGTDDDRRPVVLDGHGTAPFDDVGGPGGWDHFIAAVTDPTHEDHDELREWAGMSPTSQFDPTAFDVDQTNRALHRQFRK